MDVTTVGSPALWAGFIGFVLVMLAVDLGVFNRRAHEIRMREALVWSVVWITLSLLFGVWIWHHFGAVRGLEFFTGYLLEKALSVDNLFVFIVLFSYFAVPVKLQHRVLFWGILGALVMRAIFILAGAALIHRFHWIIFVFGVFLIFTGIKLLRHRGGEMHPERNPVLRVFRRLVPLTTDYRGARFFVREGGRWLATPLLMVLVVVEATDIVFAVDSIPAIFAITTDPFIVFTSNIFAILGLRSLYFLLAGMMGRFRYLKVGLGLVLVFVGIKMLIADVVELPVVVSLGVIATLLGGSIAASQLRPVPERPDGAPPA
ncbi:MAG: TerC family protein [Candidatus Latescibacteria bacterium]|nr:TerC family protein [Candidatus Latescibacterota bacterium]